MFSCRLTSRNLSKFASCTIRTTVQRSGRQTPFVGSSSVRSFRLFPAAAAPVRGRFGRISQLKNRNPQSDSTTIDIGRLGLAAAGLIGLGGLCYYGMASVKDASSLSAVDRAAMWPDYVRERIKATYAYLAGGAAIAAGSAVALSRSPAFCRVMLSSGWAAPIGMMIASMGAGVVCQMLPYPESGGLSAKHAAWVVFAASIGGMLMPVCFLGGPILTRAAIYTGGIVGGLSAVAATAPSERFLHWGGPLAIGLGVVVVSSLGSMFLSPVSRIGSGMAVISLYGGLLLFSGFLLYDTQLVVKRAESAPPSALQQPFPMRTYQPARAHFDPINNSIHILMDTVNIFVRIVSILAGGQRRK